MTKQLKKSQKITKNDNKNTKVKKGNTQRKQQTKTKVKKRLLK